MVYIIFAILVLWRSPAYRFFFSVILIEQEISFMKDEGDAPIHSLATGLFLDADQIDYFEVFGYQHDYYCHCPSKQNQLGCRYN